MSETAINIGNEANPQGAAYCAGAITEIFKAGFDTRQSEAVMIRALDVLQSATAAPTGTSIVNCNFDFQKKSLGN